MITIKITMTLVLILAACMLIGQTEKEPDKENTFYNINAFVGVVCLAGIFVCAILAVWGIGLK